MPYISSYFQCIISAHNEDLTSLLVCSSKTLNPINEKGVVLIRLILSSAFEYLMPSRFVGINVEFLAFWDDDRQFLSPFRERAIDWS